MGEHIFSKLRNNHFVAAADTINLLCQADVSLSKSEIRKFLQPRLIGSSLSNSIIDAFTNATEQGLGLLGGEKDKLSLYSCEPLLLSLTWLEANSLFFLLKSGRSHLFLGDALTEKLLTRLTQYAAECNRSLYDYAGQIEVQGRATFQDDPQNQKLKSKYQLAYQAVQQQAWVSYRYPTATGAAPFTGKARTLCFSPLDELLWLRLETATGSRLIRVGATEQLCLLSGPPPKLPSPAVPAPTQMIELLAIKEKNTVERLISRFSRYDREISFERTHAYPYHICIHYPAQEQDRVLLRLRAFGDSIRVLTPALSEIRRAEAYAALAQYEQFERGDALVCKEESPQSR